MTEKLLDTEETAKILGLARQTLDVWRVRGRGPRFIKVGRAVRYRESDLQSYLDGLESFSSTAESGAGEASCPAVPLEEVGVEKRVPTVGVDSRL